MDPRLFEILVCPVCKGPLDYMKADDALACKADRLVFPIRDGMAVMFEDEARPLSDAELEALRAR